MAESRKEQEMEESRVYADLDGRAKNALNQKTFGFGWKDLPEILQTISGLHQDGSMEPAREENGTLHFSIDLPTLKTVVEEARRVRKKYSSATETTGSFGEALRRALD